MSVIDSQIYAIEKNRAVVTGAVDRIVESKDVSIQLSVYFLAISFLHFQLDFIDNGKASPSNQPIISIYM